MKTLFLILFLVFFSVLQAGEVGSIIQYEVEVDSLTVEQVCLERGHYVIIYNIYREGVMPYLADYGDSTILYYYENNIKSGIVYFCTRCKQWIGSPIFDEPKQKILWKRERIDKDKSND